MKFRSKRAIFGVICVGFEGLGPCLVISRPTHPHLGKHSQKKTYFYLETFPNLLWIDHCIDTGKNLNLPLAHFTSSKLIYQRQEAIRDMMVDSTDDTVRAILIRLMGTRDLYGIGSAPMGYACIASETRVPEFVR